MLECPSQFILSVLALPIVLGSPHLPRRMPLVAMLVFAGSVIISFALQPQHGQEVFELLGLVLIPLAVATAVKATGLRVERIMAFGFSLWIVYILTGLVSVLNDSEVVGLSGNRNWASSMYLGLGLVAFALGGLFFLYGGSPIGDELLVSLGLSLIHI